MGLERWLREQGEYVYYYSGPLTKEQVLWLSPKLVISYNYSYIIPEEIIRCIDGQILNLHISYLPWNRGSDPNFWSFVDDTPKGVTIHQLSVQLDQGEVLLQQAFSFDEKVETFRTTYEKLNDGIVKLFQENFTAILKREIKSRPQQGTGTYHTRRDRKIFLDGQELDWEETIFDFKKRMNLQ
ncbi:MAG: formyl transferase [Lachnospiraceae bacterium]|nr:formyl transferase [Lachnospiraceae bacterium]